MHVFKSGLLGLILTMLLSQCATMMGERTVSISAAQLQQKLNHKLMKPLTVMRVLHLQFSNAQVTLDPASGRIHTTLDASLGSEMLAGTATGRTSVSGLLRFDAARQAVMLDQPVIDAIQLDNASPELNGMLQQVAREAGARWLNQLVLYEVRPEDLTYAGVHYQPTEIRLTADEVQVKLKPQ